jgi:hypothetical protein
VSLLDLGVPCILSRQKSRLPFVVVGDLKALLSKLTFVAGDKQAVLLYPRYR